jgi:hypothetical protein
MANTLDFVRLDFRTVKPYATIKNLVIFLMIAGVFIFFTDSGSATIGILMAAGSMYVSYPFAVGEQNGIDTLYATLPITRGRVVSGRYVFAICADLLAGAFAFAVLYVFSVLRAMPFDALQALAVLGASLLLFSLIQAVQLPIYFRYGYAKAKMLAYLPYLGAPLLVLASTELLKNEAWRQPALELWSQVTSNVALSVALVAAIWLVLISLSCQISKSVYSRRDF